MRYMGFPAILAACTVLFAAGCGGGNRSSGSGSTSMQAPPLAYEGFAYPVGATLLGQNGGSGDLTGAWTERGSGSVIASGSLSFGNLATSGNSFVTKVSGAVGDDRSFITPPVQTSGVLFISYLVKPLDVSFIGGPFAYFELLYGPLSIGMGHGSKYYSLESTGGTGQVDSKVPVMANQTTFLVARITFGPTTDTVDLFVNPTPGQPLPAVPDATKTDLSTGTPTGFSFGSTLDCQFDEVRFGTTFAAVAPTSIVAPVGTGVSQSFNGIWTGTATQTRAIGDVSQFQAEFIQRGTVFTGTVVSTSPAGVPSIGSMTGTITGNSATATIDYGSGNTSTFTGTISGTTMTGTFTNSSAGTTLGGTFTLAQSVGVTTPEIDGPWSGNIVVTGGQTSTVNVLILYTSSSARLFGLYDSGSSSTVSGSGAIIGPNVTLVVTQNGVTRYFFGTRSGNTVQAASHDSSGTVSTLTLTQSNQAPLGP